MVRIAVQRVVAAAAGWQDPIYMKLPCHCCSITGGDCNAKGASTMNEKAMWTLVSKRGKRNP
jgi:hypothetical protein